MEYTKIQKTLTGDGTSKDVPVSISDFTFDNRGTVAAIDGMFAVMIITIGIAFLLALPGLIGFSADMQQGYAVTSKSIQAMDIAKAIIFSQQGEFAAFAFTSELPPDDGNTPPAGTFEGKMPDQWLEDIGITTAYNDFYVYMKTPSMQKYTPVLNVQESYGSIWNPATWLDSIKKFIYNLEYDSFGGGEKQQGRFNTQITTDNGTVILLVVKGSDELTNTST